MHFFIALIGLFSQISMATVSNIEGKWKGTCLPNSDGLLFNKMFTQNWLDCSDTECDVTHQVFSDNKCTIKIAENRHTDPYALGSETSDDVYKIAWTWGKISLTIFDPKLVDKANQSNWCGDSDWVLERAKIISGKACWGQKIDTGTESFFVAVYPRILMTSDNDKTIDFDARNAFVKLPMIKH